MACHGVHAPQLLCLLDRLSLLDGGSQRGAWWRSCSGGRSWEGHARCRGCWGDGALASHPPLPLILLPFLFLWPGQPKSRACLAAGGSQTPDEQLPWPCFGHGVALTSPHPCSRKVAQWRRTCQSDARRRWRQARDAAVGEARRRPALAKRGGGGGLREMRLWARRGHGLRGRPEGMVALGGCGER